MATSSHKAKTPTPSKRPSRFREETPQIDENDPTADAETEFLETGHIPDRDQIFDLSGYHRPSEQMHQFEQAWSGDDEERMLGFSDIPRDVLDELQDRGCITGAKSGDSSIDEMILRADSYETPIARAGKEDYLWDDEVQRMAAALSIPGRQQLSRLQLVMAIKAAEATS